MKRLITILLLFLMTASACKLQNYRVGRDIPKDAILSFELTDKSDSYPPYYTHYEYRAENGTYTYTWHLRKGRQVPLTEEDVISAGTRTLTQEEWDLFYSRIVTGTVHMNREIDPKDPGPWAFLYWKNAKDNFQTYHFPSPEQRLQFIEYCEKLVNLPA